MRDEGREWLERLGLAAQLEQTTSFMAESNRVGPGWRGVRLKSISGGNKTLQGSIFEFIFNRPGFLATNTKPLIPSSV